MNAKELIEAFAKRQREGRYPCPRCGRDVICLLYTSDAADE